MGVMSKIMGGYWNAVGKCAECGEGFDDADPAPRSTLSGRRYCLDCLLERIESGDDEFEPEDHIGKEAWDEYRMRGADDEGGGDPEQEDDGPSLGEGAAVAGGEGEELEDGEEDGEDDDDDDEDGEDDDGGDE